MANTYKEHDSLPSYELVQLDAKGLPLPSDALRWAGPHQPPAIGEHIQVTMNSLGPAVVVRYFEECGFLGLLCRFENPPAWYVKQNGSAAKPGHIFGTEFKPLA